MPQETKFEKDIRELGLIEKCKFLMLNCKSKLASEWASIEGMTVNSSFYEVQLSYSYEQLVAGLERLGIDYNAIPKQKKWWQSKVTDRTLRLIEGIKQIKLP
jgi:hypothetical protein